MATDLVPVEDLPEDDTVPDSDIPTGPLEPGIAHERIIQKGMPAYNAMTAASQAFLTKKGISTLGLKEMPGLPGDDVFFADDISKSVIGTGEAVGSFATGAVAFIPAMLSGAGELVPKVAEGLAKDIFRLPFQKRNDEPYLTAEDWNRAQKAFEQVSGGLSYRPQTEWGQQVSGFVGLPFQEWDKAWESLAPAGEEGKYRFIGNIALLGIGALVGKGYQIEQAVKDTNWYRMRTNKERGLVVTDVTSLGKLYDELIAQGIPESELARRSTAFRDIGIKRRMNPIDDLAESLPPGLKGEDLSNMQQAVTASHIFDMPVDEAMKMLPYLSDTLKDAGLPALPEITKTILIEGKKQTDLVAEKATEITESIKGAIEGGSRLTPEMEAEISDFYEANPEFKAIDDTVLDQEIAVAEAVPEPAEIPDTAYDTLIDDAISGGIDVLESVDKAYAGPERRHDELMRKKVSEMTTEEKDYALHRDTLTGMQNLRAFTEFERDNETKPDEKKHIIGMIDIDGFKAINDTFGHDRGDAYLKEIARVVKALGLDDFIYRIGGDEYGVKALTPGMADKIGKILDTALQDAKIDIEVDGQTYILGGAGFSYGYGKDRATADENLYADKWQRSESGERIPGDFSKRIYIKDKGETRVGRSEQGQGAFQFSREFASDLAGRLGKVNELEVLESRGITNPTEQVRQIVNDITRSSSLKDQFDNLHLDFIMSRIQGSEAGKRTATPEGEALIYGSSFPEWYRNKGYNKTEIYRIISKVKAGDNITDRQTDILTDLVIHSLAEYEILGKPDVMGDFLDDVPFVLTSEEKPPPKQKPAQPDMFGAGQSIIGEGKIGTVETPQTPLEKAVEDAKKREGQKGQGEFTLDSLGFQQIYEAGKSFFDGPSRFKEWYSSMKDWLGNHWDTFKEQVLKAWEMVKRFNEHMGQRGSVPVGPGGAQLPSNTKQRIRIITGQKKLSELIREDAALHAAFKKAEQNARVAFKAGNKEGIEEQKAIMKDIIKEVKDKQKRSIAEKKADNKVVVKYLAEEIKSQVAKEGQGDFLKDLSGDITPTKVDRIIEKIEKTVDKQDLKTFITQLLEQKKEDIDIIKKLSEPRKSVDVAYQKKIIAITEGLDFKKMTQSKLLELKDMFEWSQREGVMTGLATETQQKVNNTINRLWKVNVNDLSAIDVAELRDVLETLTALGKLKRKLQLNKTERERQAALKEFEDFTVPIDPKGFDPNISRFEASLRQQTINAGKEGYLNLMSPYRVAAKADGYVDNGPHQRFVKEQTKAAYDAKKQDTDRLAEFLQELSEIRDNWQADELQATLDRLNVVALDRMKAFTQRDLLMKEFKFDTLPELTEMEEKMLDLFQRTMNKRVKELAVTMEYRTNEPFPERDVYYFPLKYRNAIAVVNDNAMGRGKNYTKSADDYMTKGRKEGVKLMPRTDLIQVIVEAIHDQNWYIEMQPVLDRQAAVLLSKDYQGYAGAFNSRYWQQHLDIVARGGISKTADTILPYSAQLLRTARMNISKAVLSFKLSSWLVQPLAVMDAMAYALPNLPLRTQTRIIEELGKVWLNPKYAKEIQNASLALTEREGAGELSVEEIKKRVHIGEKSFWEKFNEIDGMKWMKNSDLKTATAVQQAVEKVLTEDGVPNAKAEAEMIMEMVSSSTNVVLRPHVFASGEWMRTLFTFQSFALNQWQILMEDVISKNLKRGDYLKRFKALLAVGVIMAAQLTVKELQKRLYEATTGKDIKKKSDQGAVRKMAGALVSTTPLIGNGLESLVLGQYRGQALFDAPVTRTVEKGIQGADALLKGQMRKGGAKALESFFTLKGVPGTAQTFDLAERMLPEKKKGTVKIKKVKQGGQ